MMDQIEAKHPDIDPDIADALGEVVASIMKHDTIDHYRRERDDEIHIFDPSCTGHYEGCLVEAEEMIHRLRQRGYDVVKVEA